MATPPPVRVGFVSLGCPKNLVDTEVMLGNLRRSGCELAGDADDCEVIVVNTCGFIEPARRESVDTILEMARRKTSGRCRRLVVAGCLVQRYHEELRREIPEIDAFVGLDQLDRIVEAVRLETACSGADPLTRIAGSARALYDHRWTRVLATRPHVAYLKIAEGCDHTCAFCAIPGMRGRMRSRSVESLRIEAERLAEGGVREVILIAQDTTDYGRDLGDGTDLAGLLRALEAVQGLEWIRILYAYPNRLTDRVLDAMRTLPKVCPYLDLPLQHADPGILRAMRRGGGRAIFHRLLAKIRRKVPGCAVRTTLLVGFPGETREAFEELRRFVEEERFDALGVFPYSHEEETPAHRLPDDVPRETKEERRGILMEIQAGISLERNRARIGQTIEVRVDAPAEGGPGMFFGRTARQAPDVDGRVVFTGPPLREGDLVPVRVEGAGPYDLTGAATPR
jgi:ribosomal protein S12 methylthiotransferase